MLEQTVNDLPSPETLWLEPARPFVVRSAPSFWSGEPKHMLSRCGVRRPGPPWIPFEGYLDEARFLSDEQEVFRRLHIRGDTLDGVATEGIRKQILQSRD